MLIKFKKAIDFDRSKVKLSSKQEEI